jgi:hypothetical protein
MGNAPMQSYLLRGLSKVTNGSKTFIPKSFCSYYSKDNLTGKHVLQDEKKHICGRRVCALVAYFVLEIHGISIKSQAIFTLPQSGNK